MDFFVFILIGISWASWIWMLMYLTNLVSFQPLFLQKFFLAYSFILCSEALTTQILDLLMLSDASIKLCLILSVFSSCCSDWIITIELSSVYWLSLLSSLFGYWGLPGNFCLFVLVIVHFCFKIFYFLPFYIMSLSISILFKNVHFYFLKLN